MNFYSKCHQVSKLCQNEKHSLKLVSSDPGLRHCKMSKKGHNLLNSQVFPCHVHHLHIQLLLKKGTNDTNR